MAAPPAHPPEGDAATSHAASLVEWLRGRDDRQLARLLQLRPDLARPAPPDLTTLAARIAVRPSTQRAVDGLDARTLRTLEKLVLAADAGDTVAPPPDADLDALFDLGLIWGDADAVHLVPTVRESVGPHPAGLGRPARILFGLVPDLQLVPVLRHLGLPPIGQPRAGAAVAEVLADPERVTQLLAECDAGEREVLARLAAGPPVGTVRNTRLSTGPLPADGDETSAPYRLINRGLLVPIDAQRVELPHEVGLVLRGEVPEAATPAQPPPLELATREPAELDRLGTTAVLEFVRLVVALADAWTAQPPPLLRSGGVGVRELRRTARDLGVDEPTAVLVAEVGYAAALLNSTNGPEPVFLPTAEYDVWRTRPAADRWITLAAAWLAMTRQPSLVNQRGERDRMITALSPDAERGTVPALRRNVLDVLVGLPPGAAPRSRGNVLEVLAWQAPRRASGQRPVAEAVLAEADMLGLTAAGGLTGYSRTLLAGPPDAARDALAHALPEPIDHFLVQPDLTAVVPGPPQPAMGAELALLADLESTGGAYVYRFTERSVRRALDAGRNGERLTGFVERHSRTPVPQALRYLIDDAARRHGRLRAGAAASYLRCDDETLLARVLADRAIDGLHLRSIAPTVVVSDAPAAKVLDALRGAGYSPAAEAPGGGVIALGADAPRAPTRPPARSIVSRGTADSAAQLAELVRRMRSGDALTAQAHQVPPIAARLPGVTSAATMELLRRAVREDRSVWLRLAETDGSATVHEINPISLAAGVVRGYERGRDGLVAYPVHRITAVRAVDD